MEIKKILKQVLVTPSTGRARCFASMLPRAGLAEKQAGFFTNTQMLLFNLTG